MSGSAGRPARTVISVLSAAAPSMAGLRSAPLPCGELQCQSGEYCSQHVFACRPCSDICEPQSNNFQRQTCETSCQDYLHSLTYQTKQDEQSVMAAMTQLEDDMHRLIILVSAMFCLLVVCFVIATFYACANYRHSCRRRKKADMEAGGGMELKKIGAKLANGSSVAPAAPPVISPKASTVPQYTLGRPCTAFGVTSAKPADEDANKGARSRHPSEDTLPEDYTYSAVYDNPALSITPPLATGSATSHPLAALRSRDSVRRNGSSAGSSMTTEVTRVSREGRTRLPREVDITDLSPQTAVPAT